MYYYCYQQLFIILKAVRLCKTVLRINELNRLRKFFQIPNCSPKRLLQYEIKCFLKRIISQNLSTGFLTFSNIVLSDY